MLVNKLYDVLGEEEKTVDTKSFFSTYSKIAGKIKGISKIKDAKLRKDAELALAAAISAMQDLQQKIEKSA